MSVLQDDLVSDVGSVPRCQACKSERVVKGAWTCWNPASGLWELETILEATHCHQCESATKIEWHRPETPPQLRIRELNDRFRKLGLGNGSLMITAGVQEKGEAFVVLATQAVQEFEAFDDNNDPWGEHDFGAVNVKGERVFFKFDYYAPDLTAGSENPANEGVTHRVLTIMLTWEY